MELLVRTLACPAKTYPMVERPKAHILHCYLKNKRLHNTAFCLSSKLESKRLHSWLKIRIHQMLPNLVGQWIFHCWVWRVTHTQISIVLCVHYFSINTVRVFWLPSTTAFPCFVVVLDVKFDHGRGCCLLMYVHRHLLQTCHAWNENRLMMTEQSASM